MEFFTPQARERLLALHPKDGDMRYSRLIAFMTIAAAHPRTPLVVPPEVDPDLHEVLATRGPAGLPLELVGLQHYVATPDEIGRTVERRFNELTTPLAVETRALLAQSGWVPDPRAIYTQPACIIEMLDAA